MFFFFNLSMHCSSPGVIAWMTGAKRQFWARSASSRERDQWKALGSTTSTNRAARRGVWWMFLSFSRVVYIWSCSQMRGIRGLGTTMVRIQTGPHHLPRNHKSQFISAAQKKINVKYKVFQVWSVEFIELFPSADDFQIKGRPKSPHKLDKKSKGAAVSLFIVSSAIEITEIFAYLRL